ncbi:transposase [Acetobacteraceae bacterium ESL0709]|nr:transposase [Acetobacteraceae bacterium ESL0697]MDF7677975.1 transposase [Acetobacteraceae bacterium ESL0709]
MTATVSARICFCVVSCRSFHHAKDEVHRRKQTGGRYQDRDHIERMFNHFKQRRRIATRYDKTALSFMSFLNLAAAKFWINSFVNMT